MACWVPAAALIRKESVAAADTAALRKIFKKHEELIRERIARKITQGMAESDRTYCLHPGEF